MIKWWVYGSLFLFLACAEGPPSTTVSAKQPLVIADTSSKDTILPDTVSKEPAWQRIYDYNTEERLMQYGKEHRATKIRIKTDLGDIDVELFEDTPLHRASMLLMIQKGVFESTYFYRVRKKFIVQAGLAEGPEANKKMSSIGYYKIPPEIKSNHPHVRGAFAMAGADYKPGQKRDRRSNPFTFYIVQGDQQTVKSLTFIADQYDKDFTADTKDNYLKKGGTPHLDGEYTVCGHVTKGMDVVKKLSELETGNADHPKEYIYLSIEILE